MPESQPSVTLRAATPDDEPFLFQLYASTRQDEFKFLDWGEQQKQALMRMQYDVRRSQYDAGYPEAQARIILSGDRPAGRMLVDEGERDIVLVDIALLPEHRNCGIGTHLIRQLLDRASETRKPVKLQVLKSNPALRLYERLGFARAGDQSMYLEMIFEPTV